MSRPGGSPCLRVTGLGGCPTRGHRPRSNKFTGVLHGVPSAIILRRILVLPGALTVLFVPLLSATSAPPARVPAQPERVT
jgi:hypothetical protein